MSSEQCGEHALAKQSGGMLASLHTASLRFYYEEARDPSLCRPQAGSIAPRQPWPFTGVAAADPDEVRPARDDLHERRAIPRRGRLTRT